MDWSRDARTWDDTFFRPILIGGRRAGIWRRTIARKSIAFEAQIFASLTAAEQSALDNAIGRYGAFMGLSVNVTYV